MLYVGVDLGTSAVKLLLMEADGTIRNIVSKRISIVLAASGMVRTKSGGLAGEDTGRAAGTYQGIRFAADCRNRCGRADAWTGYVG